MKKQSDPSQLPLPLQFLQMVQCSEAIDRHHLIYDPQKGFETRVTLDRSGKKLVGSRIRVRLKTHDEAEAAARRDIVFDVFRSIKVPIRDRRQKRQGKIIKAQDPWRVD